MKSRMILEEMDVLLKYDIKRIIEQEVPKGKYPRDKKK